MQTNGVLNHRELYRLPWTLPDNAISWLEPTAMCNLACDGCYRNNEKNSHKSLEEVKHELDVFQRNRNSDCISIAGGDPLLYPNIVELVAEIKRRGLKPIINTNGKALNREFLKELKKAGVYGFTFHIDSKQGRGGEWRNKNELELNDLRYYYARMLADEGNIACSFNSTVYEDTLQYVPGMVEWAQNNIDIVHTMVFIAFRHVVPDMPFDWFAGGKKIDWQSIMYHSDEKRRIDILSTDLVSKIREKFPDFSPAAYLNGTEKVDSFKWLLTERVGVPGKIYGYLGPKFLELVMAWHHFFKGTYLSYASPKTAGMGRSAMLFLWPFDKGLRKAAKNMLKNPFRIFKRAYMQSIMMIQPVDFMPDGRQSMCDGCPDITVWNDELVWSCRLEEQKQFGTFLRSVKKN
ncbi:radical SAM protein [Melioribacteraceae bacterium 4301-Me]|uniref:radical SAM protein n=1 Tax=Pyranulibacter aquaticus TaxID=3163344 RepID=UPI003594AB7D